MEVKIQEITDVSRELEIVASAEELEPHFEKAYAEYQKKIEIRGFRKGKAPLDMIKRLYGDLIEHDSLEAIASEFYRKTVKEKDLKPIGEPTLVDMNYDRGKEFRFKIRYDVRPTIRLKDYKTITVQRPVHTVTNEEIENEMLSLRRSKARLEQVEKVTDLDHVVTVDAQEIDEYGTPILGKKDENVRLYLADERLNQQYRETLTGAVVGETYRVRLQYEHEGHTHTVHEELTVKKIEKVILPELNEAFITEISNGKFKTLEEYRADLKKKLEQYWNDQSERTVRNAVVTEIVKLHDFQVPDSLIRAFIEQLLEDIKKSYPKKELPADFDYDGFFERNREYAIAQAKWALLREELLKEENITITDQELEQRAEEDAKKMNIPKERVVSYYKSSEQMMDRLAGEKLMSVLLKSVKIVDVPDTENRQTV
ncbi:MAG: trigger factor [Bacteroidetes bacterium]|nr:trigger factor [Bacteroidota bacterium]